MGNNEVSSAVEIMINMIIVSIIIVAVMGTVAIGNKIKEDTSERVDLMVNASGTSYEDIETLLTYPHEIPLATVFKIVNDNQGNITRVDGNFVNPNATIPPFISHPNMTTADYTSRFSMKVSVGGIKEPNGTYTLVLWEVQ